MIATKSTGTQTVKCGPEECTTVIFKQASRHALAKNASHRSSNCDSEQKNSRCRCSTREITNGKQSKHNKSANKQKNGCRPEASTPPVHHMQAVPISAVPITVPISECLICNAQTKAFPNRHDLTNNNYWSKANQHFFRQLNGSQRFDYIDKHTDPFDQAFDRRAAGLLYIGNGSLGTYAKEQKANEAPKDRVKSNHNSHQNYQNHQNHHNFDGHQTTKNVLSALPTRLNNSCLTERAKDHKTPTINGSLDSKKEKTNKITHNFSSIVQNHQNDSNFNNGLYVDSSFNVKIEIGSSTKLDDTSDEKCQNTEERIPINEPTKLGFNENNTKISTNIHSSNSISKNEEQMDSSKHPILTSATTVTTSMSLPNGYNGYNSNNYNNTNGYNKRSDWVQLSPDVTNGIKSLKICNEDNEKSNLSSKQNNLLSDIKINSIPHLSPIRQKVAKAKAEFFNSTGAHPQSPMSPMNSPLVTNLLIDK